jgi:hypothetical protein
MRNSVVIIMVAVAVAFLDEPCRNGDAQRGELAYPN